VAAFLTFAQHAVADDTNVATEPSNDREAATDKPAEVVEPIEPAAAVQPTQPVDVETQVAPVESENPVEPASPAGADPVTERRGGFVVGVSGGLAFGWATGNPSGKSDREDPTLERSTGLGIGHRVTPFLGGALTDWFTVGLGMTFGRASKKKYETPVTSFVFHLEAFPLYGRGGFYRDVGVSMDFGAGVTTIVDADTSNNVANSGVASTIGVGAFWEPLRAYHFAAGPYVGYQHNWSRWFVRNNITVGLRLMFYGVQP